ncbi:NTP transferase domain-containing protein [Methanobrevibacter sp. TMH8]|uniref:NTP transferase domain-containing protein n=1 Tax=Methanobrevibacter sp. TMH8 TaxID=2848611 RepID=UPI001CD023CD|nr:NTP transferase domain-containing protein [Methanobrevibacter sp. TMH8]MBZ9570302.1 NTP transferase domain-containing protein [Methanobrevibacter sp. TMH8]
MIIAVLMAGGKGKRLNTDIEKPLFKFKDKSLIEYVLKNLKDSKYIEKIVVATSPHTMETNDFLAKNPSFNNANQHNNNNNNIDEEIDGFNIYNDYYNFLETPGYGYLEDLSFLLSGFEKKSKKDVLLFINADLPFVSSEIIDNVLEEYFKNDNPAMSVLVPLSICNEYGIEPSCVFEDLVPSGLNILISQNKVQKEDKLIIPKIELALNINTNEDVKVANYLFDNNLINDYFSQ